jgi:hypothetical protein
MKFIYFSRIEILGFGDVLNLNFFFQFWGVYFWIILVVSEIHFKKKFWKYEIWYVRTSMEEGRTWTILQSISGKWKELEESMPYVLSWLHSIIILSWFYSAW